MNRYLVSVITPNYVLKAGHYLDSLAKVRSAKAICVLMETPEKLTKASEYLWEGMEKWLYPEVPTPLWQRPLTHSHNMVQWGVFLDALPFAQPEDLICLTDTDLVVQRDLTAAEWEQIEAACAEGNFCASWNCGPTDTLFSEGNRIGLSTKWAQREFATLEEKDLLPPLEPQQRQGDGWLWEVPCFNCGVLFATVSTFRRLQAAYESRCADFYKATAHRSRCQFLINYCLWVEGIGVAELPAAVHVHGHWSDGKSVLLPEGSHWRGSDLWVGEEKVVFRHNLEAPQ